MDPTRWQRIQEIFDHALEIAAGDRTAFVRDAAGGDTDLADRVHALLAADAGATFLDADVGRVAHAVLHDEPSRLCGVGMSVGPYRLKAPLGEGGTGVVYLATRDDIGQDVALKVLRDAWVSEQRRDRFLREQRTLAKLNHPAIAGILDAGVLAGGTPWFAMELVHGLPLDEYCRQHVTDVVHLARLFRTIGAAVQHAHERLVVHRDLKPSNIVVTNEGQPTLLDFGIARQLEQAGAGGGHTGPLRILTPGYASPEELRGESPGVQADVYSLGVVFRDLLKMIAGKDSTSTRWLGRRAHYFDRAARRDLELICDTATQVDTARRYPTADAFVRDLDAWLAGRPLAARPASTAYRLRRFVSRNRRGIAAALAALAIAASVVFAYGQRLAAARAATDAEAARSERLLRFMLDLFSGGEQDGAAPADLRVVSLLDRGERQAEQLQADRHAQGELFHTLGRVSLDLGELERADRLLSAALAARRTRNDQPAEVVRSLVALCDVRIAQDRLDDAEKLAADALALAVQTMDRRDVTRLEALTAVGRVREEKGEYATAAAAVEEAVAEYGSKTENERALATAIGELSNIYFYIGDMARSDEAARRALEITRRVLGPRHPDVGHLSINLGAIASTRARIPEAERYFREALDVFRTWYGEDHPETAAARTNVAQALSRQTRYDEAAPLLDKALATQRRVYGAIHPRAAFVENEIGLLALLQKDLPRAEEAFTRAVDGYRSTSGTRFQEGVSLVNLATVYLNMNDARRAEPPLVRALEIYAESLPPDHLRVGIARGRLGRALLRQGRIAEAHPMLVEAESILSKQTDPSWLKTVREDLATLPAAQTTRDSPATRERRTVATRTLAK